MNTIRRQRNVHFSNSNLQASRSVRRSATTQNKAIRPSLCQSDRANSVRFPPSNLRAFTVTSHVDLALHILPQMDIRTSFRTRASLRITIPSLHPVKSPSTTLERISRSVWSETPAQHHELACLYGVGQQNRHWGR